MRRCTWLTSLALVLMTLPNVAARADCFDVYGCTDRDIFKLSDIIETEATCDFLYQIRNGIYKEHGYCFKTPRAISELGNDGCRTSNLDALGLNRIEQTNAETILQAEKTKSCPE